MLPFPLPRTRGRGVPEDLVRRPCDERCQLKLDFKSWSLARLMHLASYGRRVTNPTDLSWQWTSLRLYSGYHF
jgi:hypothetical protein